MRDMAISVAFSAALTLTLYFLARPFFGPDAGAIVGGAVASGPFFAEYLKKRRIQAAAPRGGIDIYREAGYSWRATVAYGVLLMVGAVSLVSFAASLAEHSVFASLGIYAPHLIAYAIGGAVLPAILILYFQIGKLFALCRHQQWTALLAVIFLGPLALRLIDFLLIPQSWFDTSFPWADRTWLQFGKFMFWTTLFFGVPVTLGALWYSRSAVRLRVSSMMRLLPRETQAEVAELVHEEFKRSMRPAADSGDRSPRWSILTPEGATTIGIRLSLLMLFLFALTASWSDQA